MVKAITSRANYVKKFKAVGVAADTQDPCSPCGSMNAFNIADNRLQAVSSGVFNRYGRYP